MSVPATREFALAEFDVGFGRFQHMRGDLLALVDDLVGGEHAGAAAAGDREREAKVPPPSGAMVGVAVC